MPQLLVLYLASLTLRSLCLMAVAGIATVCLRNVALRHAVWVVTLGSILLLPLGDALLPVRAMPAPIPQIAVQPSFRIVSESPKQAMSPVPEASRQKPSSDRRNHDWWQTTLLVYAVIVGLLLLRTGIAHARVWRLKRRSSEVQTPAFTELVESLRFRWRTPKLVESPLVKVPVTVGFFKPIVLIPEAWHSWSPWNLRAVLAHELTHVRRADWAITVLGGLNRCLFWFNPLSWWLERKLGTLAEQASDEASISLVGDAPRYAEVLLAFATEAKDGHRFAGGMAMARLNIRARIDRILTLQRPQSGILKRTGWITIILVMLPVFYIVAAGQGTPPRKPATAAPEPRRIEPQAVPQQPRQEPQGKFIQPTPDPVPELERLKSESLAQDVLKAYQDSVERYQNNLLSDDMLKKWIGEAEGQKGLRDDTLNRWLHSVQWSPASNYFDGFVNDGDYKLPPNITLPPNSYAFLLTGTQGSNVSFRRAEGTTWNSVSYGCQNCSFFVNENGVGPENLGGPGILFKREEKTGDMGDLTLTCRARECWATQVAPWSIDPVSARFKFDVAKFDVGAAANLSQVLIIVSR